MLTRRTRTWCKKSNFAASTAPPLRCSHHNVFQWNQHSSQIITELQQNPSFTQLSFSDAHPQHFLHSDQGVDRERRFQYTTFLNKEEKKLIGVVHFGSHVAGAPGYVQGGAIASILDFVMGTTVHKSVGMALTAYLNLNYRKAIPLCTTVICEGQIERVEKRKIFINGVVKSLDGSHIYTEANGLWINMNKEQQV